LNTLPAISLCARLISLKDNQANLLVLPSDHYIKDNTSFKQTIIKALNLSLKGFICLMGIRPDSPCSGYGYIKTGKRISDGIFYVDSFKEKPACGIAKRLFKNKDIFWNSGIFCFKAEVILMELETHVPRLYREIIKIDKKQDIKKAWHKIKPLSIDYGLLEKTKKSAVVAAKFYWRDLGSWDALCEILSKDRKNNILLSDCLNLHSDNIFVFSQGSRRVVATIGLQDLIIVDTPDALLVCKKEMSQDVKRLVEFLKQKRMKCV
jgi:mannose-1-phosphate guanylyltransferase/mannose-6-phosphate isomerase